MKANFHTFTAAPLFTSAELEQVKEPKYKKGDIVYISHSSGKYIITVDRFEEPNKIYAASYKYKATGKSFYRNSAKSSSDFFYNDGADGSKIHPTLESLEGLGPIKVGDTVYLTNGGTMFVVQVNRVDNKHFFGPYKGWAKGESKWFFYSEGSFYGPHYKRHATEREMKKAAKNA